MKPLYDDRADAGRHLAALLRGRRFVRPLVLGVPRGGVPVAREIALALNAELDVLLVHKLSHPRNPELAIGAVGEGGVRWLAGSGGSGGVTPAEIERESARRAREIELRAAAYRTIRRPADARGRDIILTDDGAATGATLRAGVMLLRARHAGLVVVAVPIASVEAARALKEAADDFVCPRVTDDFSAVAEFYRDFTPTTDDQVERILRAAPSIVINPVVRPRPPSGV
ncbi:MAG TPA: phosphoribosyltransferase [Phycisphaerales bacterium]|nr:phosphoribosyltransferase [Phycisphaerales bacterium]